ncbi:MAG: hypothetical protein PHP65_00415 [Bacilli bacterium]|nr:hypothetical protein [Bacilli bacterium]
MKERTASEIVNGLLDLGISQQSLAEFLGVTRQTISKCADNYELTKKMNNLKLINKLSCEDAVKMIQIDVFQKRIMESLSKKQITIDKALRAFEYMEHWCTDPKYPIEFINYLFGHIVNFHMRYSPYALLIRDYFGRENHPVLTISIDYTNAMINDFHLESFMNYSEPQVSLYKKQLNLPITLHEFIDYLYERLGKPVRINVYLDYQDDEFDYIDSQLKGEYKTKFRQFSVFDFSRMFNFFETNSKIGPQLDKVLANFQIEFDENELLKNCEYRAKMIVKLVKMQSLYDIRENLKTSSDVIFDGSSKNSKTKFINQKRRELKK